MFGDNTVEGVHLGFYASTMLQEFVLHRGHMRRFTYVHILQRMGFGAADMNQFGTCIDDTLFRRVFTDTRIGFLAESFSPRVRVLRGMAWLRVFQQ